ncbi:hypothetical protein C1889_25550 [Pseudomonas sp. FW507-12TSA]|uniref:retropepsin-like aspartic protease n=2 Tax=Pseudomonas TaxID=286 RepID=UPI000CD1765A|nr:retropepsin-like aspartic protease [Pseudomonas sp. MPFS]POA51829.1 hypothetical protein C1889_25550 [Pseudomonas sp. FW507-12TSA]UMZ09824.1 retroviral-like aspartic protease family protein [Pseudomonas sp. MPFS]
MMKVRGLSNIALMYVIFLWGGAGAFAASSELSGIEQATFLPKTLVLSKLLNKNNDQSVIAAIILRRSLQSVVGAGTGNLTCAQIVTEERQLACQLLLLGEAFNQKNYQEMLRLYRLLDGGSRAIWSTKVPGLNDQSLAAIDEFPAFEQAPAPGATAVGWQTVDNGFLMLRAKPYLTVEINGVALKAKLDTGASVSHLSAVDARRLNLQASPWEFDLATYYQDSTVKSKMVLLKTLDVSGQRFKNFAVLMGSTETLLGLDILSKLGRISINASGITFSSTADQSLCESKVFLGSNLSRTTQFLFTYLLVDGEKVPVLLDTGNMEYLSGGKKPLGSGVLVLSNRINDLTGSYHEAQYQASEVISLAGKDRPVQRLYSPTRTYLLPYVLGWNAFEHYQLVVDFNQGWGCLNNVQ